jgi:hypothetical protein
MLKHLGGLDKPGIKRYLTLSFDIKLLYLLLSVLAVKRGAIGIHMKLGTLQKEA